MGVGSELSEGLAKGKLLILVGDETKHQ